MTIVWAVGLQALTSKAAAQITRPASFIGAAFHIHFITPLSCNHGQRIVIQPP